MPLSVFPADSHPNRLGNQASTKVCAHRSQRRLRVVGAGRRVRLSHREAEIRFRRLAADIRLRAFGQLEAFAAPADCRTTSHIIAGQSASSLLVAKKHTLLRVRRPSPLPTCLRTDAEARTSSPCVVVRERPAYACGDFLVEWSVYFASGRLTKSSRKSEFGERGHWRIPADV
jgi:hypothetical protein